jgi:hypothetical protein
MLMLWSAAIYMISLEHFDNLSGQLWTTILFVQSTPYAASLLLLLINVMPNAGSFFLLTKQHKHQKNA